ncbi:MAG TPA: Mur ligase domain-containing protein [Caulobacteraceae bacterium]
MHVYFLGIAGAGVSALASVLASEGHTVSGSDDGVFPPVSTYLTRMGIPYHVGFDPAQIPLAVDVAIVGSSAKLDLGDNPELAELIARGIPRYSFAEYLGVHTVGRETIVVAGSFGKSSLTALVTFLMREAGKDPGYFIGAVPLDLEATGHAGRDKAFVIEGDEYVVSGADPRSKFLLYHPHQVLLSSIVHDHVNVFPTMAAYEAPFAELLTLLPKDHLLVCAQGYEPIERLTAGRPVVWYGLHEGAHYRAANIVVGETTRFDLITPSGAAIALTTQLLGLHNIENIAGAAALLLERGDIDAFTLRAALPRFRGVARRLDKKTTVSRVPAYEGFGSSYEKARSAIEAITLHFPARPAVVVFEPHTFSWRNQDALAWYDTVFEGVSRVLLLPPPGHGAASHHQLTQADILARIRAAGVEAEAFAGGPEVLAELDRALTGEEVLVLLSSGPLAGLAETAPALLDKKFG